MKGFYERIRRFFSSARGRDILLYLLFVLVSFVFWVVLALGNSIQNHYKVKLRIERIPEGTTIISDFPEEIDVSVKNNGYAFVKYMLGDLPEIPIDFSGYSDKKGQLSVSKQELDELLHSVFGTDALIETFSPDHLSMRYTDLPGKKLPVRILGDFTSDIQFVLNGNAKTFPDSVLVYSDVENLNRLEYIQTSQIVRHNLKDTLSVAVPLKKQADVKIVPDSVRLMIPVEPLVSKKQEVAVTVVNLLEGRRLVAFPARVQVSYLLPLSLYNSPMNLLPLIYVDYTDAGDGVNKLPLKIGELPSGLQNVVLATDSVEYILE